MLSPNQDDAEEKPLDPAVARVQQRLQRLMLIAGLTLGLGLLAVFGAIIYRISAMDNTPPVAAVTETEAPLPPTSITTDPPVAATVTRAPEPATVPPRAVVAAEAKVPADARLVASTVAGDRIVLTYDHFGGTIVLTLDPETLTVLGRLDVTAE